MIFRHQKKTITPEEIALAMELQSEGCLLKLIAYGLGYNQSTLESKLSSAKKLGFAACGKRYEN